MQMHLIFISAINSLSTYLRFGLMSFFGLFFVTLIIGIILIPLLKKLSVGQQVRDDGPSTHLIKSGTPTFGGIMFLIPLLAFGILAPFLSSLSFLSVRNAQISPFTVITIFIILMGLVGFIDDYIKVRVKKGGLSAVSKSVMLLVIIIGFTLYYMYFSGLEPHILLPFTGLIEGGGIRYVPMGFLKIVYGWVIIAVLYITSNSANITDGVDGLASSVTALICIFLGLICGLINSQSSIIAFGIAFAIAGGCIGFFVYNRHPAKLFMGDTGAQALGAGVAVIAIISGVFWILIPVAIIYVLESASVVIQVFFYKRNHKRVFRMAPLHHHFELCGWSEWKVILVFCLVTFIGGVIGLCMIL